MELLIRSAAASDLPQLVRLLDQLYGSEGREDLAAARAAYERAFAEIAADPRQTLYVGELDGRIVASAVLAVIPNLTHRGRAYGIVENVVTDEAHRGKRYGEALMRRIAADARTQGCHKIALMSRNERKDAHRFYERIGYVPAHVGFRLDL